MTIFAQDNFNSPDAVRRDLTNHVPQIGGAWLLTNSYFSGAITIYEQGYSAAPERANVAWLGDGSSNNRAGRFIEDLPEGTDVILEADMYGSTQSSDACFLLFRADPAKPLTYYSVGLESGGRYLTIRRNAYSDGGAGSLPVFHQLQPGSNLDMRRVRVECVGNEIKAYVDGVLEASWIDPEPFLRVGRVGIGGSRGTRIDNFEASNPDVGGGDGEIVTGVGAASAAAQVVGAGVRVSTEASTASSVGQTITNIVGRSASTARASAPATSFAYAQSYFFLTGFGDSISTATAQAIGVDFVTRVGSFAAAASASSNMYGRATVLATGVSEATAEALAEGYRFAPDETLAEAFASSTAQAVVTEFIIGGAGRSNGRATAVSEGIGQRIEAGVGSASGSSSVDIIKWGVFYPATAQSSGRAFTRSIPQAPAEGRAMAAGRSTPSGRGSSVAISSFDSRSSTDSNILMIKFEIADGLSESLAVSLAYAIITNAASEADPPEERTYVVSQMIRAYVVGPVSRRIVLDTLPNRQVTVEPLEDRTYIIP